MNPYPVRLCDKDDGTTLLSMDIAKLPVQDDQVCSAKASRLGDRCTCQPQPLNHSQIFGVSDVICTIASFAGESRGCQHLSRLRLADTADNWRGLAVRSVASGIKLFGFIRMRPRGTPAPISRARATSRVIGWLRRRPIVRPEGFCRALSSAREASSQGLPRSLHLSSSWGFPRSLHLPV